ncbi:hypothetical protein HK098_003228 [Nowakowskiella sp. JEL0407]|nr:hypothetical protein HK098_003228 [Nowakowskiella sp. JEL0407]
MSEANEYKMSAQEIEIYKASTVQSTPASSTTSSETAFSPPGSPPAQKIHTIFPGRFRVLVCGRAGVGKSTVVDRIFGLNGEYIQNGPKGVPDINKEYISSQNHRIIIHESNGIEPKESSNMNQVAMFLTHRAKKSGDEMLHCIWYCIDISDDQPVRDGDLKFFESKAYKKVPVVILFTKKDVYVNRLLASGGGKLGPADVVRELDLKVKDIIGNRLKVPQISAVVLAHNEPDTFSYLESVTMGLFSSEKLKLLWIQAQQLNCSEKIATSVDVGLRGYGLAGFSSWLPIPFSGMVVASGVIYRATQSICEVWNVGYGSVNLLQILDEGIKGTMIEAGVAVAELVVTGGVALFFKGVWDSPRKAKLVMRAVADAILINDMIYWKQRREPLLVTDDVLKSIVAEYKQKKQKEVAKFVDKTVGVFDIKKAISGDLARKTVLDACNEFREKSL